MYRLRFLPRAALWTAVAAAALPGIFRPAADTKRVEIKVRSIDLKEAAGDEFCPRHPALLAGYCDECHSADDHKGGFRHQFRRYLEKRREKGGPGIVPGKPDESSIVKYIRGLADGPQMPKGETPFKEEELHLIRSWIAAGALDDSALAAMSAAPRANAVPALTRGETQKLGQHLHFRQRQG